MAEAEAEAEARSYMALDTTLHPCTPCTPCTLHFAPCTLHLAPLYHSPVPASSSPPLRVHLALLVVELVFGGFHVVAKGVLSHLDPLSLAAIRVVAATPLLLLLAWRTDRFLPRLRHLPWLALLGTLGVFANQVLYILGLERTKATSAAVLMPSIPVFAVALGALLGVERTDLRRILGVSLTVLGALVMLQPTRLLEQGSEAVGNALVLLNCSSYAAFLVVQRPLHLRIPWRTLIAWTFLFGSVGVLSVSAPTLGREDFGAVPATAWLGVAYIVIFPTVLGYSLSTWAVKRSSPSLVAAYVTLQPLFAAILASIFLAETPGWREAAGFVLISAGLGAISVTRGPDGRRGSPRPSADSR